MSGVTCFVAVRMGPCRFSVPTSAVREVVPAVALQAHADRPEHVLGLMDHRGSPVPVVCPSVVFEGAAPGLKPTHHIVVLQEVACTLGLPVEMLVMDPADVHGCPALPLEDLCGRVRAGAKAPWAEEAWQQLQSRLQDDGDAEILTARARSVRTPKASPPQHLDGQSQLCFTAGAQPYTLRLDLVWETVLLPPLTQVPGSPPRVAGVCQYRGGILTVIDLPAYLGHCSASVTTHTRALIVGRAAPELALILDGVPRVQPGGVARFQGAAGPAPLDLQALLDDSALYADRREARQPRES